MVAGRVWAGLGAARAAPNGHRKRARAYRSVNTRPRIFTRPRAHAHARTAHRTRRAGSLDQICWCAYARDARACTWRRLEAPSKASAPVDEICRASSVAVNMHIDPACVPAQLSPRSDDTARRPSHGFGTMGLDDGVGWMCVWGLSSIASRRTSAGVSSRWTRARTAANPSDTPSLDCGT